MRCPKNYPHQQCDTVIAYDFGHLQCGDGSIGDHSRHHDIYGKPNGPCQGADWEIFKRIPNQKVRADNLYAHYRTCSPLTGPGLYWRSTYNPSSVLKINEQDAVGHLEKDQSPCGENRIGDHRGHKDRNGKKCTGPNVSVTKMEYKVLSSEAIVNHYPVVSEPIPASGQGSNLGAQMVRENRSGVQIVLTSVLRQSPCHYGDRIMRHSHHSKLRCPGPRPIYCPGLP